MIRPRTIAVLSAVLGSTLVPLAHAQSSFTSVYQRDGFGTKGSVQLGWESAFGTREARPFGEKGLEQGIRSRFSISDTVAIEAWGGLLVDTSDTSVEAGAFSAEAQFGVLQQQDHRVNLSVGAGFLRDFQAVSIPLVRACLSRRFGPMNVAVSGLAEVPLAENRDPVDLIVEVAAAYEVSNGLHVGVEAVGEDLEAFWEPEEAEGGAKMVLGPSARLARGDHVDIRFHAGAVIPATVEQAASSASSTGSASGTGFLGRLTAGYTF